MKINGNAIRPGNIIEHQGGLWRAVKIQHTQPGKGGAYLQVELKDIRDGTKLNERFRSSETVERVRELPEGTMLSTPWAELHPDLSYGSPTTYHIPYTDAYLEFLSKSISDAVSKTGVDGFMIDWLWMPKRESTEGKWLECEKKLYQQLMGEPFPGEDTLSKDKDTEFSRKAIDRCWKAIRKAAKDANPKCVIWLTVNHINHPHVIDSDMYKEADWLMNEAGSLDGIRKIEGMVGKDTHLITCMAVWNGQDASKAVPEALAAGVGLYGFTAPKTNDGLIPLDKIFSSQVSELSGDDRNIAVLARAYHGMSSYAVWHEGEFREMKDPPPFRLSLQGRGRGLQDTARIDKNAAESTILITTPYGKGSGQLSLTGKEWPSSLVIRLHKKPGEAAPSTAFRMGLASGKERTDVSIKKANDYIEITVPAELTRGNPEGLAFEWE